MDLMICESVNGTGSMMKKFPKSFVLHCWLILSLLAATTDWPLLVDAKLAPFKTIVINNSNESDRNVTTKTANEMIATSHLRPSLLRIGGKQIRLGAIDNDLLQSQAVVNLQSGPLQAVDDNNLGNHNDAKQITRRIIGSGKVRKERMHQDTEEGVAQAKRVARNVRRKLDLLNDRMDQIQSMIAQDHGVKSDNKDQMNLPDKDGQQQSDTTTASTSTATSTNDSPTNTNGRVADESHEPVFKQHSGDTSSDISFDPQASSSSWSSLSPDEDVESQYSGNGNLADVELSRLPARLTLGSNDNSTSHQKWSSPVIKSVIPAKDSMQPTDDINGTTEQTTATTSDSGDNVGLDLQPVVDNSTSRPINAGESSTDGVAPASTSSSPTAHGNMIESTTTFEGGGGYPAFVPSNSQPNGLDGVENGQTKSPPSLMSPEWINNQNYHYFSELNAKNHGQGSGLASRSPSGVYNGNDARKFQNMTMLNSDQDLANSYSNQPRPNIESSFNGTTANETMSQESMQNQTKQQQMGNVSSKKSSMVQTYVPSNYAKGSKVYQTSKRQDPVASTSAKSFSTKQDSRQDNETSKKRQFSSGSLSNVNQADQPQSGPIVWPSFASPSYTSEIGIPDGPEVSMSRNRYSSIMKPPPFSTPAPSYANPIEVQAASGNNQRQYEQYSSLDTAATDENEQQSLAPNQVQAHKYLAGRMQGLNSDTTIVSIAPQLQTTPLPAASAANPSERRRLIEATRLAPNPSDILQMSNQQQSQASATVDAYSSRIDEESNLSNQTTANELDSANNLKHRSSGGHVGNQMLAQDNLQQQQNQFMSYNPTTDAQGNPMDQLQPYSGSQQLDGSQLGSGSIYGQNLANSDAVGSGDYAAAWRQQQQNQFRSSSSLNEPSGDSSSFANLGHYLARNSANQQSVQPISSDSHQQDALDQQQFIAEGQPVNQVYNQRSQWMAQDLPFGSSQQQQQQIQGSSIDYLQPSSDYNYVRSQPIGQQQQMDQLMALQYLQNYQQQQQQQMQQQQQRALVAQMQQQQRLQQFADQLAASSHNAAQYSRLYQLVGAPNVIASRQQDDLQADNIKRRYTSSAGGSVGDSFVNSNAGQQQAITVSKSSTAEPLTLLYALPNGISQQANGLGPVYSPATLKAASLAYQRLLSAAAQQQQLITNSMPNQQAYYVTQQQSAISQPVVSPSSSSQASQPASNTNNAQMWTSAAMVQPIFYEAPSGVLNGQQKVATDSASLDSSTSSTNNQGRGSAGSGFFSGLTQGSSSPVLPAAVKRNYFSGLFKPSATSRYYYAPSYLSPISLASPSALHSIYTPAAPGYSPSPQVATTTSGTTAGIDSMGSSSFSGLASSPYAQFYTTVPGYSSPTTSGSSHQPLVPNSGTTYATSLTADQLQQYQQAFAAAAAAASTNAQYLGTPQYLTGSSGDIIGGGDASSSSATSDSSSMMASDSSPASYSTDAQGGSSSSSGSDSESSSPAPRGGSRAMTQWASIAGLLLGVLPFGMLMAHMLPALNIAGRKKRELDFAPRNFSDFLNWRPSRILSTLIDTPPGTARANASQLLIQGLKNHPSTNSSASQWQQQAQPRLENNKNKQGQVATPGANATNAASTASAAASTAATAAAVLSLGEIKTSKWPRFKGRRQVSLLKVPSLQDLGGITTTATTDSSISNKNSTTTISSGGNSLAAPPPSWQAPMQTTPMSPTNNQLAINAITANQVGVKSKVKRVLNAVNDFLVTAQKRKHRSSLIERQWSSSLPSLQTFKGFLQTPMSEFKVQLAELVRAKLISSSASLMQQYNASSTVLSSANQIPKTRPSLDPLARDEDSGGSSTNSSWPQQSMHTSSSRDRELKARPSIKDHYKQSQVEEYSNKSKYLTSNNHIDVPTWDVSLIDSPVSADLDVVTPYKPYKQPTELRQELATVTREGNPVGDTSQSNQKNVSQSFQITKEESNNSQDFHGGQSVEYAQMSSKKPIIHHAANMDNNLIAANVMGQSINDVEDNNHSKKDMLNQCLNKFFCDLIVKINQNIRTTAKEHTPITSDSSQASLSLSRLKSSISSPNGTIRGLLPTKEQLEMATKEYIGQLMHQFELERQKNAINSAETKPKDEGQKKIFLDKLYKTAMKNECSLMFSCNDNQLQAHKTLLRILRRNNT